MIKKRLELIEDVFADHFNDTTNRESFETIYNAIELFGCNALLPTGATPSKPDRQGDSQLNPFVLSKQPSCLKRMFELINAKGLIKDRNDLYLPDPEEDLVTFIQNSMKWNAFCNAVEVMKEMEVHAFLLIEALRPLYFGNEVEKSPMQVYFFTGNEINGSIMREDSLLPVPWSTMDKFKQPVNGKPGMFDVVLKGNKNDIWWCGVPEIDETMTPRYTEKSETFAITTKSIVVLSSDATKIIELNFIKKDPPVPEPENPDDPPVTPVPYDDNEIKAKIGLVPRSYNKVTVPTDMISQLTIKYATLFG
jgi:hypothetical protein